MEAFNCFKYQVFILFFLLFSSLSAKNPTIIAHRGNSCIAPENSLAAFQSAAQNNIPFFECDLHLTKDKIPVVIHDRYLSRTTNTLYPVAVEDLTLKQIKQLDTVTWFNFTFEDEKILTLKELLKAPLNDIGIMLEIKEGSASNDELVHAVVKVLRKYAPKNRTIILGSITPQIVIEIKMQAPWITTIGIVAHNEQWPEHRANNPDYYAINRKILNPEIIKDLHHQGKKVWVWTVDEEVEMLRYREWEVDGIISNHPTIAQNLIH